MYPFPASATCCTISDVPIPISGSESALFLLYRSASDIGTIFIVYQYLTIH